MNSIILLGRTTNMVELKQTQAGKSVASFSLAVKRPFTKDTTDFHTVVCWDKQAELISKYVNKGDQVCIRGYLTTRTWTDNQGQKRYATEVVADEVSFVGPATQGAPAAGGAYTPEAYATPSFGSASGASFEESPSDDSLPF